MSISYHFHKILEHLRSRLPWRTHRHLFHVPIPAANFLHVLRLNQREERKRRARIVGIVALVLLIVTLIIGAFAARSALRIARKANTAKDHILYSISVLRDQEFEIAVSNIHDAQFLLQESRSDLRPWRVLKVVPYIGRQFTAVEQVLITAEHLSLALERSIVFGQELVNTIAPNRRSVSFTDIDAVQKRRFLEKLFDAPPVLQAIQDDVDAAVLAAERIPSSFLLPPLHDVANPIKEQLPRVQRSLKLAIPVLEAMPLASGYPEEQTYLFLFQNNDELRPTGGFIGTYGIVRIRDGEILEFFTDNIYRIDRLAEFNGLNVPPPPPLQKYLKAKKWFMRDANWSPDFRNSAQQVLWFYEKETNNAHSIDGVITFTPTVAEQLLHLLGSIAIEEVTFTPQNLVDTLQYYVEQRYAELGLPEIERKEVVGKLATTILERAFELPLQRIPDLFDVAESALEEKHILMYAKNPRLQNIIASEGWAGDVKSVDDDFIMVVDANLAALKTDSVMERRMEYSIEPEGDRLKAQLRVHYTNTGRFSWKTTRYRTYTRIYLPKDATVLRSQGFMLPDKPWDPDEATIGEDLGKTVVEGFVNVEPNATETVTIEYLLPRGIEKDGYSLYWQKQAGTHAIPLTVQLQFDTKIDMWSPTGFNVKARGKKVEYQSDLRFDREFKIRL